MAILKCPICKEDMINNVKGTKFGVNGGDRPVLLLTCLNCDGYLGAIPTKD